MKPTSQEARQIIEERILAEYKKHPTLDWAKIAAHKIYSTLFDAPTREEKHEPMSTADRQQLEKDKAFQFFLDKAASTQYASMIPGICIHAIADIMAQYLQSSSVKVDAPTAGDKEVKLKDISTTAKMLEEFQQWARITGKGRSEKELAKHYAEILELPAPAKYQPAPQNAAGDNWKEAKNLIDIIRAGNLGREKSAYFSEIHDAVDLLEKSIKWDNWISVATLPEEGKEVKVMRRRFMYSEEDEATYTKEKGWTAKDGRTFNDDENGLFLTHWKYKLPSPPSATAEQDKK